MKRLLLGPALVLPLLTLGFCEHKPQLPKVVPEVVREIPLDDFNAFPPMTTTTPPTMPTSEPHKAPVVKHRPNQVKPHAPLGAHPRPNVSRHLPPHAEARPPAAQAPVETLPPQQGTVCIFPLNFIPNCTPQAIQ